MRQKINFLYLVLVFLFSCNTREAVLMYDDIFQFYIGEWECTIINDGSRNVSLTSFFDSNNIAKLFPVINDYKLDSSFAQLSINILIIRNQDHTIIIDPGLGKDMGSNEGKLMEKLKIANIDSSEVDYVIISHGHWDHIGGIATSDGKLYFPNAHYFMPQKEWEFWTSEKNLEMMPENLVLWAREDLPPIRNKVTMLYGNEEFIPGITAIPAYGHTPGQIALLINSKSKNLFYVADALHFSFQVAVPNASPVADMEPTLALETRKRLINEIYENDYKLMGFHFDFPGLGEIKIGDKYQWEFEKIKIEN